jgi:hypothetical protein
MHLDPDFEHLTYRDQRERAKQLRANLSAGDLIVFYAGLRDVRDRARLVYAIIGVLVVEDFILATNVRARSRHTNAHSRTSCCGADASQIDGTYAQGSRSPALLCHPS